MSKKEKQTEAAAAAQAAGDETGENEASLPSEKSGTPSLPQPPDCYEQMLRLRAEFDNYRKRVEREKSAQRAWAKEEVLVKQISLLDIMTQALSAAKNTSNVESVITGLEMIIKEFEKMLSEEGVTAVEADGRVFDPGVHEAVETVEDDAAADGQIKEVIQKGYFMGDRLIRPARVKIVRNNKNIAQGAQCAAKEDLCRE